MRAFVLLLSIVATPLAAQVPAVSFFPIPEACEVVADGCQLVEVVKGPDGRLWTASLGRRICALRPDDGQYVCAAVAVVTGGIASGADGNVWFGTIAGVGKITPSLQVTLFETGGGTSDLALGPDGNLWYAAHFRNVIGKITPAGEFTEFPVSAGASPDQITSAGDSLWAVNSQSLTLIHIELDGTMTIRARPFAGELADMIVGHDGNLWIANTFGIKVVNAAGTLVSSYPVIASSLTRGPGDSIWFGSQNGFGRIANGAVAQFEIRPATFGFYVHPGITTSDDGAIWMSEYVFEAPGDFIHFRSPGLRRVGPGLAVPLPALSLILVVALAAALAAWALFALR